MPFKTYCSNDGRGYCLTIMPIDKKLYIQVTYLLASENTIEREFSPLKNIEDNYPKYVLSMDNLDEYNINGILRKRIIDFLLDL